ncbi:sigma-70 family RNA polymerase sigma factor [Micromonospora sp. WMMD1128]|uniref:RNA polymerase sigma factor n=1 Tax=Micromonospora sp. WMMD1128 TaxID=3015150 RepID=UPI00248C26BC|nr:sigma-70 family RNA polymerase sigma factor [Micromonospora sp. WMMD1128]WBB76170.1 sigma-70 family RNA polymerase sigma factor [Micromonospora sp. WMMD1128]
MAAPVDVELVTAARRGDRGALAALLAAHLSLVYRVVGRALAGHPDVDDVTQEVMLRVVERLPALRDPERFRAWLVTIAIRQVREHARRRAASRQVPLDPSAEPPDPAADVAGAVLAGVGRDAERRDVHCAVEWLDPDDREVLALWWRELNGELNRADLAAALAVGPAHAAVRIQRMRARLAQAYTVLGAWRATPRCPELALAARGWDGALAPLWRKRLGRHVLACPRCLAAGGHRAGPEQARPVPAGPAAPAGRRAAVGARPAGTGAGPTAFWEIRGNPLSRSRWARLCADGSPGSTRSGHRSPPRGPPPAMAVPVGATTPHPHRTRENRETSRPTTDGGRAGRPRHHRHRRRGRRHRPPVPGRRGLPGRLPGHRAVARRLQRGHHHP